MKYLIEEGRALVESGMTSIPKIKLYQMNFKVLLFTSGTTSNAKGVMLSQP